MVKEERKGGRKEKIRELLRQSLSFTIILSLLLLTRITSISDKKFPLIQIPRKNSNVCAIKFWNGFMMWKLYDFFCVILYWKGSLCCHSYAIHNFFYVNNNLFSFIKNSCRVLLSRFLTDWIYIFIISDIIIFSNSFMKTTVIFNSFSFLVTIILE